MKRINFKFGTETTDKRLAGAELAIDKKEAAPKFFLLRQDPPMSDLDEVIMLLHTAAEIEHALLAEYLYAGYSLRNTPHEHLAADLVGIAREEMGHLMSVQNILVLLGAPLNFEREDYPFNRFYPFPFTLEPCSVKSVARYVLAEMPDESNIPAELGFDLNQLKQDAGVNETGTINRVGPLYALLVELVSLLPEGSFLQNTQAFQASGAEWSAAQFNLILNQVTSKEQAITLLREIGEQGEGFEEPPPGKPASHFRRFFDLYKKLKALPANELPVHIPVNPGTTDDQSEGYISNPVARLWCHVFNVRYRILLAEFTHYFYLDGSSQPGRKRKIRLKSWSLDEMKINLRSLAGEILLMPQHEPARFVNGKLLCAAPPFELPYSLNLPAQEKDRWRYHKMLLLHSNDLINQLLVMTPASPVLTQILTDDQTRLVFIDEQINS